MMASEKELSILDQVNNLLIKISQLKREICELETQKELLIGNEDNSMSLN